MKASPEKEKTSLLFRMILFFMAIFRKPYRWAKKKWPGYFEKHLNAEINLDTTRMLNRFNRFHRLFFGRGFEKIRFNEEDLQNLKEASEKGPVVLLMRNWGQVEYNYFNYLFLEKKLPLVTHNNMVKMTHWMRRKVRKKILRRKIDHFFMEGSWPYNRDLFNLEESLKKRERVLYCLDLPKGGDWIERSLQSQGSIVIDLLETQEKLEETIQLVPLNFIYDKHPGRERKTLGEILFGEKDNPEYLRKILLFLRNYKKRAVAKIGNPIDFRQLVSEFLDQKPEEIAHGVLLKLQKIFEREKRQVTGPKLKSRQRQINEILSNPHLKERLQDLATAEGTTLEKLEKRVQKHLKEISSDINFTVVELWNYFLNKLFNRFYDGLHVDIEGIAKIKKIARDRPLVFIPSHKSHIDYLLLGYVFYQHNLSLPHVCAGRNLNFWPLGPIFRRSGAFFIRRSFAGDKVYALALKSYLAQLMRNGNFQEFFIEGTRSRSGKLFPPKLGILSMILESFLEEKDLKDVYFVPVSIDYERVIEEKAYLDEVKGRKKSGERFRDLFHLPKFLKKRYGKVYLQFSEPISLRDSIGDREESVRTNPDASKDFLQELAQKISRKINAVATLLPSSLAATALLTPHQRSITSKEVHQKAKELFDKINDNSPRISEALLENFHHAIQESLNQFVKDGLIQFHEGLEEKFYTIPEDSRLSLDFYRNQAIHFFVEDVLEQLPRHHDLKKSSQDPKDLYQSTSQLLGREFFFSANHVTPPQREPLPWLSEVPLPVLESYWLTLTVADQMEFKKTEEWFLIKKILEKGELLKLKGDLKFPECLSRFTIQNAITQFVKMGVFKNHAPEMGPIGKKYLSPGPSAQKREEAENLLRLLLKR